MKSLTLEVTFDWLSDRGFIFRMFIPCGKTFLEVKYLLWSNTKVIFSFSKKKKKRAVAGALNYFKSTSFFLQKTKKEKHVTFFFLSILMIKPENKIK